MNSCFAPLPGRCRRRRPTRSCADAERAGRFVSDREANDLAHAAAFREQRHDVQREQIDRLRDRLPLPQIELPFLFTPDIGRPQVDVLADALDARDRARCDAARIRERERRSTS